MGNWNFKEIVVIDLEATCWATPEESAVNTSEIIEVGVCILDAMTGEVSRPRSLLVKPEVSAISQFCTELTSITPAMVEVGISFDEAVSTLKSDYGISKKIVAGYGNYDLTMFTRQCERKQIKLPFGPTYLNISAMATLKAKTGKRLSLSRACHVFRLPFEGQLHRGMDDAVMAARVLWQIIR